MTGKGRTMNCHASANGVTRMDVEQQAAAIFLRQPILLEKLVAALNCDTPTARSSLCEVLRFLVLVHDHEDGMLTPSRRVDLAWHEFILCTRAYQAFCEEHFGRFIHHQPGGSEEGNQRQFEATLRLYEARFGRPNPNFWACEQLANCGPCEAI